MLKILIVGLGGAIGAMLRYSLGLLPSKGDFPILTLIINVLGALAIGIIAGAAVKYKLNDNIVLFIKTGICGGFTTFSTFSLEAFNLIKNRHFGLAALYIVLSVTLCLGGVFTGEKIVG